MTPEGGAVDETAATVVLIPGLMCDATFWEPVRPVIEADHPVVIPRLHDVDSLAAMAHHVLDSVTGPLHVIGHSMGGRVAFELVDAAPDRVRSLAVLDTGVHPVGDGEPANRQKRLDLAATGGMEAVAAEWVPIMVHPDHHGDGELMGAITAMVTSYTVEQFNGQTRALLGRRDATPVLAGIGCPTLVACGEADAWSPVDQHVEIAAAIDGARLEVIDDAGHMVAMERPDATADLLAAWLRDAGR